MPDRPLPRSPAEGPPAAACAEEPSAAGAEGPDASQVPLARSVVALPADVFETLRRSVAMLFELAHGDAFARLVDGGPSEPARHCAGNTGVFMGYDFHVTPQGPRLIEINTNAGGALINGLHTASLLDPERLACVCADLLPVEAIESRILETFRQEYTAAGGREALRSVAIVDDSPATQFLRAEFELFRRMFTRAGIEAQVGDTRELERRGDRLELRGRPIDLVYLRDTDFQLEAPRSATLREAWLRGDVVVTPSPREHHLLADKRRLVTFSSPSALRALGVPPADAEWLAAVVPETRALAELGPERAWSDRKQWVFKPARAFGSRAVYHGAKLTRRKLDELICAGDFLVQRAVDPGEIEVDTLDGPQRMKFDVRAYAYRDEILLLGARTYRGQVTNMRTPGGGFSAICVVASNGC